MNAGFIIEDEQIEKEFMAVSKQENLYGVKGHRTVGGFRALFYNALPLSSVQFLCDVMKDFAEKKG